MNLQKKLNEAEDKIYNLEIDLQSERFTRRMAPFITSIITVILIILFDRCGLLN